MSVRIRTISALFTATLREWTLSFLSATLETIVGTHFCWLLFMGPFSERIRRPTLHCFPRSRKQVPVECARADQVTLCLRLHRFLSLSSYNNTGKAGPSKTLSFRKNPTGVCLPPCLLQAPFMYLLTDSWKHVHSRRSALRLTKATQRRSPVHSYAYFSFSHCHRTLV